MDEPGWRGACGRLCLFAVGGEGCHECVGCSSGHDSVLEPWRTHERSLRGGTFLYPKHY